MSFDLMQPQTWAADVAPPELCAGARLGDAVHPLIGDLQFQGKWTSARAHLLSDRLRRFAQLYAMDGSTVRARLLDAAYFARTGEMPDALRLARAATVAYRDAPPPFDPNTQLLEAVHAGDLEMAKAATGADVNAADFNGTTPLMFAAHYQDSDLVSWLLACGADRDATDVFGETFRDYASPGLD